MSANLFESQGKVGDQTKIKIKAQARTISRISFRKSKLIICINQVCEDQQYCSNQGFQRLSATWFFPIDDAKNISKIGM